MGRRKFTRFERTFIQQRAHQCCEYCQFPMAYSPDGFHIEHIIPIRLGGSNEMDNLALACDGCNTYKWAYIEGLDRQTRLIVPLFNPRKDIWTNHFQWSDDFTSIVGLTPTARATIDLLQMNRLGLVNIRKALLAYGVLPKNAKY